MQICFLLGPAGSGKTFRCLSEIRDVLQAGAEGPTLLFVAPKQATFQLERQLLSDALGGYSRLQILSFQRLARFVFDFFQKPVPRLLSAEGRVMVLRALLGRLPLTIFRTSARRLGFAEEASEQLREFQQHGLSPKQIRKLAKEAPGALRSKLLDLAEIYDAFLAWLKENELQDEEQLLTFAAELLEANPGALRLGGVWFDGFAQLTPQERRLLASIVGESERATLAFCLETQTDSQFSPWFLVSQTFGRCRAEFQTRFGKGAVALEWLERKAGLRFKSSALEHLERHWADGAAFQEDQQNAAIRILECADAENEVVACAREISRFVRSGNRYREAAVLLRTFSNEYPHLIRRIFARYEIPFFLDHREGVAHHPLAELTRGAVRMLVFQWKHADCFTVFKTGLVPIQPEFLYRLENDALEHGWEGEKWLTGFKLRKPHLEREVALNEDRKRLIAPFLEFAQRLGDAPSGVDFAEAMRALWTNFQVESQLEDWARQNGGSIHATVWEQLVGWLANVELAFAHQRMHLRDWLPIIEAGLNGLTVGVIPPVLDQVLVGTVDRSRNPDLKTIFVLGLNEGIFPAIPPHKPLLTEHDRGALLDAGLEFANVPALQISQEQFYGYIACTRARESVVMSYARSDAQGRALNPSRFISQVRQIFPRLELEPGRKPRAIGEVEHACELSALAGTGVIPESLRERVRALPAADQEDALAPEEARALYSDALETSVVALERFAMCKFRFFLEQGLELRQREEFSLDVRQQGTFQHEVLAEYHREVRRAGKRWRDLSVEEAKALIERVADELTRTFRDGLLIANEQNRFTAENYKAALQEFIGAITAWFRTNSFDPEEVELPFGSEGTPGWELNLENGCKLVLGGRVDRLDLYRREDGTGLLLVMDYKSGWQKPDPVLMDYGVQQQLPAYLLAITKLPALKARLGVKALEPAGCFYVPLGARYGTEVTRNAVLEELEAVKRGAYQHLGIFDLAYIDALDSESDQNGGSAQFQYRLTKREKRPHQNSFSAMPHDQFHGLLNKLEENARTFAGDVYAGKIDIRPHKKGSETGCDRCWHQAICRFDPWEQEYNLLKREKTPAGGGE